MNNSEAIKVFKDMKRFEDRIGGEQSNLRVSALDHACLVLAKAEDREQADKTAAVDILDEYLQRGRVRR